MAVENENSSKRGSGALSPSGPHPTRVFLVMKHPRHPYSTGDYLTSGEVVHVFLDRKRAQAIVDAKNARRPSFLWRVHAKNLELAAHA